MTTLVKKLQAVTIGAAMTSIALTAIAPDVKAAIIAVDDSGSWITGSNTIGELGFNMITVPNDPAQSQFQDVSSLSSPLGNLGFSPTISKRVIGSSWGTWSNGYTGEVYFSPLSLTITLPSAVAAFDFYAEPNRFGFFDVIVNAASGLSSKLLTQSVNGSAGAKYFGFYSDDPNDPIVSLTIESPDGGGFAIGQMRLSNSTTAIPTPALLPGLIGMGVAALRKRNAEAVEETNEA